MSQTANSSPENKRYNDESLLLDGLYEFHPEFFDALSPEEFDALKAYYLTGSNVPESVFEYCTQLVAKNPGLEGQAQAAFVRLCVLAGTE